MSDIPTHALTFTGERFAPEVTGAIWYEHWHRYCAVASLAKELRVLDAACGEGYGSFLLSQSAKDVVGVDIAPEALAHARSRYVAANLRYVEGSCSALPLPDASVDLVVSFETIEHLWEQAEMLREFRRVLVPGGTLVISSPNQPVYSEFGAHINDYHVRELTREELASLLDPVFPQQRWYGQRVAAHSALWAEKSDGSGARRYSLLTLDGSRLRAHPEPGPPMYFVVVCGAADARLPALPALSLFDDGKQSLYADYNRALLREKQLFWETLDARKIAEDRLAELIAVTNDLASERLKSSALTDRVAGLEEAYREQSATLTERIKALQGAFDAAQAEVLVEREYANSLTWEERNARGIAESRLAELITTVNALASEREKSAALTARVTELEVALGTSQAGHATERERASALLWEERNMRKVADERLAQLIVAVNNLSSARDKSTTLMGRVAALEAELRASQSQYEAALRALRSEHEAALQALRSEHEAALQASRSELEAASRALQSELEATVRAAQAGLAQAHDRIAQADSQIAQAHGQIAELEGVREGVREELVRCTADFAAARAELDKAELETAELRRQFENAETERDAAAFEFAAMRNDLADTQANLADTQANLSDTQTSLAGVRLALVQSKDDLARCGAVLSERESRLAYRESLLGWLRFPLAWARMHLR